MWLRVNTPARKSRPTRPDLGGGGGGGGGGGNVRGRGGRVEVVSE